MGGIHNPAKKKNRQKKTPTPPSKPRPSKKPRHYYPASLSNPALYLPALLTHSFLDAKQLKFLKPEHDCYAKFTSCFT